MAPTASPKYDAFISFRHTDTDRHWARWLHRSLERYRLPASLVKQGHPKRLRKVFLDEQDFAASHRLSDSIQSALGESRFLIVVCSPRTPSSDWVNAEIRFFRELHGETRVLALLIEGEPEQSFPAELYGVERQARREMEPLAADVRPRADRSMRQRRRAGLLQLVAAIQGCDLDDLRQREMERRHRRLLGFTAFACTLAVIMALLAGWAVREKRRADENAEKARSSAESAWNALNLSRARVSILQVFADMVELERLETTGSRLAVAPAIGQEEARAWLRDAEALLRRANLHRLTWARLDLGSPEDPALEGIHRDAFRMSLLDFIARLDRLGRDGDGLVTRIRERVR